MYSKRNTSLGHVLVVFLADTSLDAFLTDTTLVEFLLNA
jgi:hypothetical protein